MRFAEVQARSIIPFVRARLAREEGQALVEYALIISLIALVAVVALGTLGNSVADLLTQVSNGF